MNLPNLMPNRQLFRDAMAMPSAVLLVVMNLLPVFGVFFLDWDVGFILAIYWLENVAIGVINVFKMLTAKGEGVAGITIPGAQAAKFFIVPFFCVHYGIFTLVHGVFVFAMFQGDGPMRGGPDSPFATAAAMIPGLLLPALGLFASHLYSFFKNYIGGGEYLKKSAPGLMAAPYGRVVILHVTIIFGGFFVMMLGSPKFVILLLVFFKTVTDLVLHVREHNGEERPR